ncbi:MAG: SAM-dependent methyltransferase, partial [Acidimicrobiales bacterium]
MAELPTPAVPAAAYDEHYFRHVCAGSDEWEASGGTQPAALYAGCLARAGLRPGEVVVDIGTGRGELLAVAVEAGAARAVGVEYSPAAVALARRTIAACGVADRAEVVAADARELPMEGSSCDLVTMLDVVEHLAADELAATLREALRIHRPNGRLLVHTKPTRTIYDVTNP